VRCPSRPAGTSYSVSPQSFRVGLHIGLRSGARGGPRRGVSHPRGGHGTCRGAVPGGSEVGILKARCEGSTVRRSMRGEKNAKL
jgi:hypothetical protein